MRGFECHNAQEEEERLNTMGMASRVFQELYVQGRDV